MSDSRRRPRSSSTDASDGRRKVLCTNSSNSPSSSSNNEDGQLQLDKQLCSVLCHPLGLPLVSAFHGVDPGNLPHLRQKSIHFSPTGKDKQYKNVLQSAVHKWRTGRAGKKRETILTSILTGRIRDTVCRNEIRLKVKSEYRVCNSSNTHGRVDIALCNGEEEPIMLLEIGLKGTDSWSKKLDQAIQYVKMKYTEGIQEPFTGPLLLAVMTIDAAKQRKLRNQSVGIKLAVFLCTRKKEKDETSENFRISLLWHSKTRELKDGSDAFGRLLRRVCDFTSWIAKLDDAQNKSDYEYFSSNCCRVDDKHVLRIYDSRVRPTKRSSDLYLNKKCKEIVGGDAKEILNLQVTFVDLSGDATDEFWNASDKRTLQVIMTPYRDGTHLATKPKSFLPIINDLEKLHELGLVHGDIRGFNTVFDEKNDKACLIDFDFGGKAGTAEYPIGYRELLADGKRFVDNDSRIIQMWHDWYALGRLIFEVYDIAPPKGNRDTDTRAQIFDLNRAWSSDPVTSDMIVELKNFLTRIDKAEWTVHLGMN